MSKFKVCMLGAFAVGKTSLVQRYVHSLFSDRYQTTLGVRIDKKSLRLAERSIEVILWDLAGEDDFINVRGSYLRGSAGVCWWPTEPVPRPWTSPLNSKTSCFTKWERPRLY